MQLTDALIFLVSRTRRSLSIFWLLPTASYELVSVSAKSHVQSDNIILSKGLQRVIEAQQLYYLIRRGHLVAMISEVAGDSLVPKESDIVERLLNIVDSTLKFGAIIHWFGKIGFMD